jgi:hypothetical protein
LDGNHQATRSTVPSKKNKNQSLEELFVHFFQLCLFERLVNVVSCMYVLNSEFNPISAAAAPAAEEESSSEEESSEEEEEEKPAVPAPG